MKNLIVSAPFGNYFNFDNATSTLGTFTRHRRAGWLKRWWRVLSTVRYNRRQQSWINKLGLPNPGIDNLPFPWDSQRYARKIISIHGFDSPEWNYLGSFARGLSPQAVELNLSCPNVPHKVVIKDVEGVVQSCLLADKLVIAKLPPVRWLDLAVPLYGMGVSYFHCCNTIPTPGGGISGKPLKQYSLWAVEELKQRWAEKIVVIGGGGVTCHQDLEDYRKAGADKVAVASILFNPFRWREFARWTYGVPDAC